jgi:hypothetical protein
MVFTFAGCGGKEKPLTFFTFGDDYMVVDVPVNLSQYFIGTVNALALD